MSATNRVSWDIHHCPLAYKCRARWERLEPIQTDPTIRFCAACQRTVHLCLTDEDYTRHTALGHCVALVVLDIGVAHVGRALGEMDFDDPSS